MKKILSALLVIVSSLAVISCDELFSTSVTVDFDYTQFKAEKALWDSTKPNNYQYRLEQQSDGFSIPVNTLIIVENGSYKTQTAYPNNDYESHYYLTINGVYERIESEYKRYHNTNQKRTDE